MRTLIPFENRRGQMELREWLGLDGFLDHVWSERAALQPSHPSTGKWPMSLVAHKATAPLSQPSPIAHLKRVGK